MVGGNDKVEAKRRKVVKLGRHCHSVTGTAFEMGPWTPKGEVKEKNSKNLLNRRGKGRALLTLSRLLDLFPSILSPSKFNYTQ